MRKLLVGALSACLVISLVAAETFAWPRGRGGRQRSGGAAARSSRSGARPTRSGAQSGRSNRTPTLAPTSGHQPGNSSTLPRGPISAGAIQRPPKPGTGEGPKFPRSPIQSGHFDRSNMPNQSGGRNPQDRPGNAAANVNSPGELATAYGWNGSAYAPFSPAWYTQHPNAWQVTHPYAGEAAVAASALVLADWLAVSEAAVTGYAVDSSSGYTSAATEPASSEEAAQAAGELAQSGAMEVADATQWLPVGIYTFQPADSPQATRLFQLAVNPEGVLRGSHFDLISDQTSDIRGAVDKIGVRASWTIGHSGKVVFECPLGELTKPDGQVTAYFPDGQDGVWRIAPLQ